MKYWKRDGIFGTMDDNGYVPDATECTKKVYEDWVTALP